MNETDSAKSDFNDMRIGAMQLNLNQIVQFHNHVHGFFNGNLAGSQTDEELKQADKNWLKQEYEIHLPNQLRKTVFLMMFGHLEEHLYLRWCDHGRKEAEKDDRKDGIRKFKKLFRNLGINVLTDQDYQLIVDAYKVRNAIIHTAGRVDITRTPGELDSVVSKYDDCFEIRNKRIYLTNEGIFRFNRAVAAFTERVTRSLSENREPTAEKLDLAIFTHNFR